MNENEEYIDFLELLNKIKSEPSQWVLFLGDGIPLGVGDNISCCIRDYRRKKFSELAREFQHDDSESDSVKSKLYQSIQDKNFLEFAGIIFGNTWDGVSFLEGSHEKQQSRRENYAEDLIGKEKINTDNANIYLERLLEVFSGIILTTCQDERIEAFLEYRNSMSVDDKVYTPYTMTTSSTWDRWSKKDNSEDIYKMFPLDDKNDRMPVLIKLYGTKSMPHRMLLSEQDLEEYYPEEVAEDAADSHQDDNLHKTCSFIEKILKEKNVFFWGIDFSENSVFPLAKGILRLLERKIQDGKKRYIMEDENSKPEDREKYHIEDRGKYHIRYVCRIGAADRTDTGEIEGQESRKNPESQENPEYPENPESQENPKSPEGNENGQMSGKQAWDCFRRSYIRRPRLNIFSDGQDDGSDGLMEKESEILKGILGIDKKDGNISKQWNETSVTQLAIAANNLADFYDLKKVFDEAESCVREKNQNNPFELYEEITKKMINDRLSDQSRRLHQILSKYGGGFPFGFLQLLSTREEKLEDWKRAAIRLAGNGIYTQHQHRKNVQKRMSYADCVMLTAGKYPDKKREQFKNKMEEAYHRVVNTYFYPINIEIEDTLSENEVDVYFIRMCKELKNILEDKREGYQQIRSLLQTETSEIIEIIKRLPDQECWKPALIYYLLCESRMVPSDCTLLMDQIDRLMKRMRCRKTDGQMEDWDVFEDELKLYQAKIIIWNQSLKKETQMKALNQCREVERMLKKKERISKKKERNIQHSYAKDLDWIVAQQIQILFLKSKVYRRLSSLAEIERCKKEETDCKEQKSLLDELKKTLDEIEDKITGRRNKVGEYYSECMAEASHIKGEYFFKMSQYYWENHDFTNRKIGRASLAKEDDNEVSVTDNKNTSEEEQFVTYFESARECYEKALEYYDKYPIRYGIQRADVMRNIADLCQRQKISLGDNNDDLALQLRYECYDMLIEAYILYRNASDLHGIANVLESMGNAEEYIWSSDDLVGYRSPFCFHKVSEDIYKYLGDEWSCHVVSAFRAGILRDRERRETQH